MEFEKDSPREGWPKIKVGYKYVEGWVSYPKPKS